MARLMITLEFSEREALQELSRRERRDPREQAALLVRESLEKRGLLVDGQASPMGAQQVCTGGSNDARS